MTGGEKHYPRGKIAGRDQAARAKRDIQRTFQAVTEAVNHTSRWSLRVSISGPASQWAQRKLSQVSINPITVCRHRQDRRSARESASKVFFACDLAAGARIMQTQFDLRDRG